MRKNGFEQMRDQVILLQRGLSDVYERSPEDPDVIEAREALARSRRALETLWLRTSK